MLSTRNIMAAASGAGAIISVPQGLIIPFNDTVVPSGFERFSAMDNRHPIGAGSTYAVGATGGAQGSISRVSANNGAHEGTSIDMAMHAGVSAIGYTSTGDDPEAGDHNHTISAIYNRLYQQLLFIKATRPHTAFPDNSIVLCKTAVTPVVGLSLCYNEDKILRSGATIATGGGLASIACSVSGDHIHCLGSLYNYIAGGSVLKNNYSGNHNHPVTFAMTDEELKRVYLTAWTKTEAFYGDSGVIALWEGISPPSGWYLCDGNNGTIDLRDCFVILSSSGNAGDRYDESNRVYIEASLDSVNWTHVHGQGYVQTMTHMGWSKHYEWDLNNHGHTSVSAWHDYTPPYYALTFVEKI